MWYNPLPDFVIEDKRHAYTSMQYCTIMQEIWPPGTPGRGQFNK